MNDIAQRIDHTLLKPEAGKREIEKVCLEALKYGFYAVCVNPVWVRYAKEILWNKNVKIDTVAGFPLGANSSFVKFKEAEKALSDGADEIDMMINVGKLKDADFKFIEDEIRVVKKTGKFVLKVIVETCLLSKMDKETICKIVMDSGADFIKTSTGFGSAGAQVEDVKLFRKITGDKLKIKASGGITDAATAQDMIEAGADRIGTSRSVSILESIK